MCSLFYLTLLGFLAVVVHSGPTDNQWAVPCDGHLVAQEVICGGQSAPAAGSRAVGDPRIKRAVNATKSDDILGRHKRNTGYDFSCSLDYPICSLGIKEKLCGSDCEDYYSWSGSTLYVDAPCNGVFTVVMCKT